MTSKDRRSDGVATNGLYEKVARLEERLAAADKALDISRVSLDAYKAVSNEWRQENIDQRALCVTRTEHEFLIKDIQDLKESRAELRGKASQSSVIVSYIISVIGVMVAVISFFHKGV